MENIHEESQTRGVDMSNKLRQKGGTNDGIFRALGDNYFP